MKHALNDLRARARVLRILGCYPRAGVRSTAPVGIGRSVLRVKPEAAGALSDSSGSRISDRTRGSTTVVWVGEVAVGDGSFTVISGPSIIESPSQILQAAELVKSCGAQILQGMMFEGPDDSQIRAGGNWGIDQLAEAGRIHGLPVVCEVLGSEDVLALAKRADLLAVGGRNMQHLSLLRQLGRAGRPVLLKRARSSTVQELLNAAEYILAEGNLQVILCEGGIRTFETATRNTLDLAAVVVLKEQTHLPVVVELSAAAGRASRVAPLARGAQAIGADGIVIEIHSSNGAGLSASDGSLGPEEFAQLMESLNL